MTEPRTEPALRALVDLVPDAAFVHRDGVVLLANDAAGAAFGLADGRALVGRHAREFLEPDAVADVAADVARVRAGAPLLRRRRARWPDGTVVVLEAHGRGVDLDGAPATLVTVRDVTARESALARLLASEERRRAALGSRDARDVAAEPALAAREARPGVAEADLRAALSAVPDPVLVVRGGDVVVANDAALRLVDAPASEVVGRPLLDFVPEEEWAACRAEEARVEAGEALTGWRRLRRSDGARRDVELRAAPLRLDGAPAVVAVLRERAAIDDARRALRASEEELRSIVATMAEGFVLVGRDGRALRANAAAARILGLPLDQVAGRTSIDPRWRAVREDGSDFPAAAHPAMVTLRTGEPCRQVVMGVVTPDGDRRWVSISSEPLREAPDDPPYAVVTTFADVTALRGAADELRDALAKVRTLSGCLPICMYCKNVRDDAGYWRRVEQYITEHSEALVSHGMCPDCAHERHADLFEDEDEDEEL